MESVPATLEKKPSTSPTPKQNILYSQKVAPYVFVLPFIISFLLFFLYPVFSTILMSFQSILPGEVTFVGLENYKNLIGREFKRALSTNIIYTILTLAILIPLPMILAIILNSKLMVAKNIFRSTLFIPALTSVVVAGIIFRLIFGELEGSVMNQFIGLFGFEPINWLIKRETGMFALVLLATWRWSGINLLYFLSGLQSIPQEIYESAEIDGATPVKKFFYITIPMLKPITIYVLTISIFGGMSMFVESYMLWNGNNSPNDIGLTIVGYLYRKGLEQFELGFGSAVGMALLGITLIVNLIQLKFFGFFRREGE